MNGTAYWWDDKDRGQQTYWEKSLFQRHFYHHKSHIYWSEPWHSWHQIEVSAELQTPAALTGAPDNEAGWAPETIRTYCCEEICSAHPGNRTTITRSSSPQPFHYTGLIWAGNALGNIGSVGVWFWKKHLPWRQKIPRLKFQYCISDLSVSAQN